jgi:hypothetical protein
VWRCTSTRYVWTLWLLKALQDRNWPRHGKRNFSLLSPLVAALSHSRCSRRAIPFKAIRLNRNILVDKLEKQKAKKKKDIQNCTHTQHQKAAALDDMCIFNASAASACVPFRRPIQTVRFFFYIYDCVSIAEAPIESTLFPPHVSTHTICQRRFFWAPPFYLQLLPGIERDNRTRERETKKCTKCRSHMYSYICLLDCSVF